MSKIFPVTSSILSVKDLADTILACYDINEPYDCRFFHNGLNDTYLLNSISTKYILRIYRLHWRTISDILYELDVIRFLNSHDIKVSIPITRKDGKLTGTISAPEGNRYFVLFSYAPGKDISYNTEEETESFLYGKSVAKIHKATDKFTTSHARFNLNFTHLLDSPLKSIEPFLIHRKDDWNYLVKLADRLRIKVSGMHLETGFCHGDFHGGNAHIDENKNITFFDFDCCGPGWRAYDIAVFLWCSRLQNKHKTRWTPFLRGYTEERKLNEPDILAAQYFTAIRNFWLLGLHTQNLVNVFGLSWLNDEYFDKALKFFHDWDTEVFLQI
jgi:Ser/Thr protein kinase RdoA (MazF antagonist)